LMLVAVLFAVRRFRFVLWIVGRFREHPRRIDYAVFQYRRTDCAG
jgi:hypothetical protein